MPPLATVSGSRAATISSADWNRSAARLARHRMTTASSSDGHAGRWVRTGSGVVVTCARSICCGGIAVNGGRPASIS
jgi:hypothetical protein